MGTLLLSAQHFYKPKTAPRHIILSIVIVNKINYLRLLKLLTYYYLIIVKSYLKKKESGVLDAKPKAQTSGPTPCLSPHQVTTVML